MADAAASGRTSAGRTGAARMAYFEDVANAPVRRFGPLTFSTELLDHLLELMGEKHPVHDNEDFARAISRRRRIVPGGFIHSITSGWAVQHGSPAAIVGLRSMHWDFVRPLYPDVPFFFSTETEQATELDAKLGLVTSVRRVFDDNERAYAIGRMSVVLMRRPATVSA